MAGKKKKTERIEPRFEASRAKPKRKSATTAKKSPSRRTKSSGRSGKRKSSKARSSWMMRLVRAGAYWSLVLGIWISLGVGALVAFYGAKMPNASTWAIPDRPPNVKILSVAGDPMANRGATGGEALLLSGMSPYIPQAVLAIEDRRFYSHFGVDPIGLARAMLKNVTAGRMVQGGSTLTQQLAKNLFLSPERTLERKVQEVLLAFWLEQEYSKDQILEMYLNRVYFGSGSYGVEAASRRYFKKSARDVNLAEAALLAGLLKAPSRLSPARDPEAAEARGQVVLEAMRQTGYVTDREITTAMTRAPTRAKSYWTGAEHYAADLVMDQLPDLVGEITEDLIVDTTIDFDLQQKAESSIIVALDSEGSKYNASQAALVSLDGTGAIRALIGGHDYSQSQFNRATEAKRQPGSAFKPFVYTTAFEQGRTPSSKRNDAPVRIGKWTPKNYDGKYRGEVTLSEALAKSLNTISAQLVQETGAKAVVRTAHRLGIESKLNVNGSIALGTSEVSLLELTSAYAPFMNHGYKATPHIIRRVRTLSGKVLYENRYNNPPRVLDPAIAAMMNQMLVAVVDHGTGKRARMDGWQVAGKTGTSQSFRDALFVGYTSNLVTGVWFGNDDGTPGTKLTGGSLPATAWKSFMLAAHTGVAPSALPGANAPVATVVPTARPPRNTGSIQQQPSASVPENQRIQIAQGDPQLPAGPVPPAAIGQGNVSTGQKTTLLDIILGN